MSNIKTAIANLEQAHKALHAFISVASTSLDLSPSDPATCMKNAKDAMGLAMRANNSIKPEVLDLLASLETDQKRFERRGLASRANEEINHLAQHAMGCVDMEEEAGQAVMQGILARICTLTHVVSEACFSGSEKSMEEVYDMLYARKERTSV